MRFLHLLFDHYPFVSDWGYQENKMLDVQSRSEDIFVITGRVVPDVLKEYLCKKDLQRKEVINKNGHRIIVYRLNVMFGNTSLGSKVQYYIGLKKLLEIISPDFIFVHDLHSFSLYTLSSYLNKNKKVKCIADAHVNFANSGRNFISRQLHKRVFRHIIQKNLDRIGCIYYINDNTRTFLEKIYGINPGLVKTELLPLGGNAIDFSAKPVYHKKLCKQLNIDENTILFVHSGKLNKQKRTIDVMRFFSEVKYPNISLIIIGKPELEIKEEFDKLLADKRIIYLGWKTDSELMEVLTAADCYLQPGSPSITAHEAMCKGCAILLSNQGGYYKDFINENSAFFISDISEIGIFIETMMENEQQRLFYMKNALSVAKREFDYEKQIERICMFGRAE